MGGSARRRPQLVRYTAEQLDQIVGLFLGNVGKETFDPLLDAMVATYLTLDEDGQVEFKGNAKAFARTYDFLGSIPSLKRFLQDLIGVRRPYTAETREIAMSVLTLEVPEDAALMLKVAPEGLGQTLLLAAAAKLYEIGRLSSGAAARLAGIPRTVFLSRLADFGVDTFSLTGDDLDRETRLGLS